MELETTVYIYNEKGLLNQEEIGLLCNKLKDELPEEFKLYSKEEIDNASSICFRFSSGKVDLTVYDHGYVLKVEGEIFESVKTIKALNDSIPYEKEVFVSPSQRVVNETHLKIKRGLNLLETAVYLDEVFMVQDYSSSLKENM